MEPYFPQVPNRWSRKSVARQRQRQPFSLRRYAAIAMRWVIYEDGESLPAKGYDGIIWSWQLIAEDDSSQHRRVRVGISRTAMSTGTEALPYRITVARNTSGRSEVEAILGWSEPPAEIRVDAGSVKHFSSVAGPQLRA